MKDDFDIKAVVAFLLEAKKEGESHKAETPYEFTCTICGGKVR